MKSIIKKCWSAQQHGPSQTHRFVWTHPFTPVSPERSRFTPSAKARLSSLGGGGGEWGGGMRNGAQRLKDTPDGFISTDDDSHPLALHHVWLNTHQVSSDHLSLEAQLANDGRAGRSNKCHRRAAAICHCLTITSPLIRRAELKPGNDTYNNYTGPVRSVQKQ